MEETSPRDAAAAVEGTEEGGGGAGLALPLLLFRFEAAILFFFLLSPRIRERKKNE